VQTGLEELGEVVVTVSPGAVVGTRIGLRCSVIFLESATERNVVPAGTVAQFIDRTRRSGTLPELGYVYVIGDRLAGLHIGFNRGVSVTEFVNTAVFTGASLSSSVFSRLVQTDGSVLNVPSGQLLCRSVLDSAVHVSSNCQAVFINGSETAGARRAGIEFSYTSGTLRFDAHLNVTTWIPEFPIQLTTSLSTLRPVAGWLRTPSGGGACAQVFQRTFVDAFAFFTDGSGSRVRARVASLVAPRLRSSAPAVAAVSETSVIGVGPGTATVTAERAGRVFGNVTVTVGNPARDNVTMTGLQVFVATALSMRPMISPFANGSHSDVVSITNQLELEDAPAGVASFAGFSDGNQMAVDESLGVELRVPTQHATVVRVPDRNDSLYHPSTILAVGRGRGPFVEARLVPDPQCSAAGAQPLASAFGIVSSDPLPPSSMRVSVGHSGCRREVTCTQTTCSTRTSSGSCSSLRMTTEGDILQHVGSTRSTAGTVLVTALFVLESGTVVEKPMTSDVRTLFVTTSNIDLCANGARECNGTGTSATFRIPPPVGSFTSQGVLSVRFTHVNLTANLSITLVRTDTLTTELRPFPSYPGSPSHNVTALRRYRNDFDSTNPLWQQAVGQMVVTTSDGTRLVLPSSSVRLESSALVASVVSDSLVAISAADVISVRAGHQVLAQGDQLVDVSARFGAFNATPARLRLTNSMVMLIALLDIRLNGQAAGRSFYTLSGFANSTTNQIVMGGRFNDSTVRPDLVTAGNRTLLPGILRYSVGSFSTVVSVENGGIVTLRGNSPSPATVTATTAYTPSVTGSLAVACDLRPAVGDVDLGSQGQSAPLPERRPNQNFNVEVRINTGSNAMGSIDLSITYPAALLQVLTTGSTPQIVGGRNWPGGIFQAVVDPPGTIRLGGVPSRGISGSNAHIATVSFRTRAPGTAAIRGSVITFARGDRAGTPIGGSVPRTFVSGSIDMIISQSRRHGRALSVWPGLERTAQVASVRSRRQASLCADSNFVSPPCRLCRADRERGDTNGDCIFDIRDVQFVQLYKVEESFGFSRPVGQAIRTSLLAAQTAELDADLDGEITPADALYLARVNFDLLRFIANISIRPVQDVQSGGIVSINVTTMKKGNVVDNDPVAVFLDLAHTSSNMQTPFDAARFVHGSRVPVRKVGGLIGIFVRMARSGPLYEAGQFNRLPERCWRSQDATETCSNSTQREIYYYDENDQACRSRRTATCLANHFPSEERCAFSCNPTFTHRADFELDEEAVGIGLSVVLVTFDSQGATGSGRSAFLFSSLRPPLYPQALSYDLPVVSAIQGGPNATVPIRASRGYSPLLLFNNTLASDAAQNEFPPAFDGNYSLNVSEATPLGTRLLSVAAVDPDEEVVNPGIDYLIIAPDGLQPDSNGTWHVGPLRISSTMDVVLATALDFESGNITFRFTVQASDRGPPFSRTSTQDVVIEVVNANDNPPQFSASVYSAVVDYDTVVGSVILSVATTDRDLSPVSDGNVAVNFTILRGNDNGTFALDEETGALTLVNSPVRRISTTFNLVVLAEDDGNPPLNATANITVVFANSDFTVTISTGVLFEEFVRNVDPSTGENRCIRDLEDALGFILHVVDVFRTSNSDASLSFYLENENSSVILPTAQVTNLLVSQNDAVSNLQGCQIDSLFDDISTGQEAFVEHFSDPGCNHTVGISGGSFGDPGLCVGDPLARRSARIVCAGSGLPDGEVDVRVYNNTACASPTLLVAGSVSANAVESGSGNSSITLRGSTEGACLRIQRPPNSTGSGSDLFVRVRCVNRTTTTITTSTVSTSTTVSSVTSTTITTVTGTSSTLTTGSTTTSTVTTSTVSTSTVTSTTPPESLLQASGRGVSTSDNSLLIALVVIATMLIWVAVILVLLRQRRQRQQIERAKLMVLAHQGDLLFGDPEPMRKDDGFSGGEIDPETGELRLYKGNDDGDDLAGMPSMWSGLRQNPVFGDLGALGGQLPDGYIDGEDLDDDSLGDLSDFDDGDFEVSLLGHASQHHTTLHRFLSPSPHPVPRSCAQAFADSLLDGTADFDNTLFGSKVAPADPPPTVRIRASVSHPRVRPNFDEYPDEADESEEDELSDLSDFENESVHGIDGEVRDSLRDSLQLEDAEVHVVQPSYDDVAVEVMLPTRVHFGDVDSARSVTHLDESDFMEI